MAKNYTTNTASLKATTIDARKAALKLVDSDKIAANKLNAKDIQLGGTDIRKLFKSADDDKIDYVKFINRTFMKSIDLSEYDYFIYDKNGIILDAKFSNSGSITSFSQIPYIDKIPSITFDLPGITNGDEAFIHNNTLLTWEGDLENMTSAVSMFEDSRLNTFKGSLKNLTDGSRMFYTEYDGPGGNHMYDRLAFETDSLESLENGYLMFREKQVRVKDGIWNYDMPNLTDGSWMFGNDDYASSFEYFNADLSSLRYGYRMFNYNYTITKVRTNLSSLEDGAYMFHRCRLDRESIEHLIQQIKNNKSDTSSRLTIGADNSILTDTDFWNKYNVSPPSTEQYGDWGVSFSVTNAKGKNWTIEIEGVI